MCLSCLLNLSFYLIFSLRPWDGMNDLLQYEHDYMIQTKTRHRTPIVRTMSITNVEESAKKKHPTRLTSLRLKRAVHKGMGEFDTGSRNMGGGEWPEEGWNCCIDFVGGR